MAQHGEGPSQAKRQYNGEIQENLNQDERLVKWFCEDLGPYDILDDNGCRNYFKEIMPNYSLPSKKIFLEKRIPKQYDLVSSDLKKMLQSVAHVAVTMDTLKYGTAKKPRDIWVGTIHFVHEGKFISQILFTIKLKLKEEDLKNHLINWGVLSKIVCFVLAYGQEKNDNLLHILDNLQIPYLYCAAAKLRLIFQDCFNYLLTNEVFNGKYQNNAKLSKKKKDEPFSWHEQFTALQSISDGAVNEEKTELTECVQVLKPFVDVTDEFAKEQYTTLSCIIPIIVCLKVRINRSSPSTNRAKELKIVLLGSIDSHFGSYIDEPLPTKATFIDPRFTKEAFMDNEKASIVEAEVIEELYGQHSGNPTTSWNPNGQPGALPSYSHNLVKEEDVSLNDAENESPFAFLDESIEAEITNNDMTMIEVKRIKIPKIASKDDPFKFWDGFKNNNEYNLLFRISRKYLCIPATAIPVQTISGEFPWKPAFAKIPERKKQIDFENVGEILFLHSFYSRK